MEKIRIYTSVWKPILAITLSFAFLIWGIYLLNNAESNFKAGPAILKGMFAIYTANFVIGLIWRKPKLIISDESVMVNTYEPWEVRFDEVDSFYLARFKRQDVIGIRYKKDVEAGITDEEIAAERKARVKYPENLHPGQPYDIYVTGMSMKPQEILKLLNEQLKEK